MRVLVATDSIGSHSSARAGALLATGWPGGPTTVLPLSEAGAGFLRSAADQLGADLEAAVHGEAVLSVVRGHEVTVVSVEPGGQTPVSGLDYQASSFVLGQAVVEALRGSPRPRQLVVDLTGLDAHDGGAGFLAALGATADVALTDGVAGLVGLRRLDLEPVRSRLAGIELVGVISSDDVGQRLLGLRGITSAHSRDAEADRAELLQTDATLAQLAQLADPGQAERPGAGAEGGLGFAVLALGGRLTTGPRFALEAGSPRSGWSGVDLVVTGCTVFDFARRGGGVVAEAASFGAEQLCPVIAIAGEVLIGSRELRTMGLESAYPVRRSGASAPPGAEVSEADLVATAQRVGRSWRW